VFKGKTHTADLQTRLTFTLFAANWRTRSKHSPTCFSHFFIFFTISVRNFLHIISVRDSLHITSIPSLYINIAIHHKSSITAQQHDPPSQLLRLFISTPSTTQSHPHLCVSQLQRLLQPWQTPLIGKAHYTHSSGNHRLTFCLVALQWHLD